MKKLRTPTLEETGTLIAMTATIFGGVARLFAPLTAGFPLNDGGLFHVMILAVQNSQYRLPEYVRYNGLNIPFAYPPLGFYCGAFLSQLLHISPVEILRWLPALIATATIPAFYWLAKLFLDTPSKAGIAALIFAFLPRSMSWSTMGGGLTRSFGLLFLLLTAASVYSLFKKQERKYLFTSILFSVLTVLSHPEAAIHTIGLCILIWAFLGRNKKGILNALLVGIGTIAITAPWWITLIVRFGLAPMHAAAQTGFHSAIALLIPVIFTLTDEPMMTLIAVLGVIGFITSIHQGKYLPPAAYILPFIVEPRSAPVYAMIPLAMLASLTISDIILPFLSTPSRSFTSKFFVAYLAVYLLGSSLYFDTQFAGTSVSQANRDAFEWTKLNTPPDSRFLVLTGETDIFCDGISEWFPALTGRASLTTIQGLEWLPGKFATAAQIQRDMQNCINGSKALDCIEEKTRQAELQYEYIYIANQSAIKTMCRVVMPITRGDLLILELENSKDHTSIYRTSAVSIFSRLR